MSFGQKTDAPEDSTTLTALDQYMQLLFESGNLNLKLGDYEDAIDRYSEAIRLNPEYTEAYFNRGLTYIYLSNYNAAKDDFSEVIRRNSEHTEAYYHRGAAYNKLADYNAAKIDFSEAIRLNPEFPEAYIISLMQKISDYSTEDSSTFTAIEYLERSNINFLLGNHENAISYFSEAMRLNPELPDTFLVTFMKDISDYSAEDSSMLTAEFYLVKSEICYRLVNTDRSFHKYTSGQSEVNFVEAFKLNPELSEDYLINFMKEINNHYWSCKDCDYDYDYSMEDAVWHFENGYRRESIDCFSRAIVANPEAAKAFFGRGVAFYRPSSNFIAAFSDFSKAIRLDPDFAAAYFARARIKDLFNLPRCTDLEKACELGFEAGCKSYNEECK